MAKSAGAAKFAFGVFEVDAQSGELRKQGTLLKLHDREFRVLVMLLQNAGQVVARRELQQSLWPGDTFVEFDNGLNNAISRLRNVLGDSPESPRFIETVPRRGYRFLAAVTSGNAPRVRVPLLSRRPVLVGLIVVVLVAAVVTRSLTERTPRINSLAVLPFSFGGPSGAGDQGYLSSAMTDAVLLNLSKIRSLRLVPREVADTYARSNKSLTEIAHALHVDAIARGSVHAENNELQVNVQLVGAADGTSLWTGSFDEPASDFLRLTRDVTRGIVRAAKLDLTPREEEQLAAQDSVNPQAYVDYLKGRYYMNQLTEASEREALSYFEQAVAAAPGFAPGYQGLASYYEVTDSMAPSTTMPKAKSYALQALKIDSLLPAAHVALAIAYFYGDWNWAASDREFTRGLELNPGLPSAHDAFAMMLSCMGRTQDALNQIQQARSLDPLYFPAYDTAALVWLDAHQYGQSARQASQLLSLRPDSASGHEDLGTAYTFEGKYSEAVQQFQDELADGGDGQLVPTLLGVAYARWGKRAQAEQQLNELKRASAQEYVPPFWFAMLYASLGANQKAFASLDRAYRERDSYMVFLNVTPFFDSLHGDRPFQKLVARMKFPG